jgi:dTDP-4-dehydrorhamnose reductase
LKKILITGSNGLLGQKLIELLSTLEGVHCIATGRGANRFGNSDASYAYYPMDITSREDVMRVVEACRPDVIIHGAAMTNVDQCETEREACTAQNIHAVQYLVDACEAYDCFLLHLSTDFIFDGTKGPLLETDLPNPISFYGWSKLEAEKIVQASRIRWAIARTVLVYGVVRNMSRSNIILWVKSSLENKKQIQVVDDQWRTPTLAEDLAMGCWLIAQKEAKGIFNLAGNEMLTPYEMAMQTASFFKLDASFITKTDSTQFTQPAKRPPRTGLVIDKARHALGYAPRSFMEGIALMASQLN